MLGARAPHPNAARLFRGFKYVIENPDHCGDFNATVKQYLEILSCDRQ
jgi:hypothetical protein